jgi:hypothetical protein
MYLHNTGLSIPMYRINRNKLKLRKSTYKVNLHLEALVITLQISGWRYIIKKGLHFLKKTPSDQLPGR